MGSPHPTSSFCAAMEHRNNKYTSDFHAKSLRLNVTGYYLAIHSSVHIYFLFALVWIRFFLSSFMRNGRSILFFFLIFGLISGCCSLCTTEDNVSRSSRTNRRRTEHRRPKESTAILSNDCHTTMALVMRNLQIN